jgi:hypothetical protein
MTPTLLFMTPTLLGDLGCVSFAGSSTKDRVYYVFRIFNREQTRKHQKRISKLETKMRTPLIKNMARHLPAQNIMDVLLIFLYSFPTSTGLTSIFSIR